MRTRCWEETIVRAMLEINLEEAAVIDLVINP
jgi:hypothetical protein